MRSLPSISLVIPNLNGSKWLTHCLDSIRSQNYPSLELIFVDGCSTDCSLDIVSRYSDLSPFVISEADSGPAQAINRGFEIATGDILHWLNSDDMLEEGALWAIGEAFAAHQDAQAVFGAVVNVDSTANKILSVCENKRITYTRLYEFCCGLRPGLGWHQPGCWWKRDYLINRGLLNQNYKALFDREFFLRILRDKPKIVYVNSCLVRFRMHDNNLSRGFSLWKRKEERSILSNELKYSSWLSSKYRFYIRTLLWQRKLCRFLKAEEVKLLIVMGSILGDPKVRLRPRSGGKSLLISAIK